MLYRLVLLIGLINSSIAFASIQALTQPNEFGSRHSPLTLWYLRYLQPTKTAESVADSPLTHPAKDTLHMDWINPALHPGEDFYGFANGNWQKNNPIPQEYASWGSFHVLNNQVQQVVHQILIHAANDSKARPGSNTQKVGDFYFSGMDEALINKVGSTPLQPEWDRIANIKTLEEFKANIPHWHSLGVDCFFDFNSMQDFKDSNRVIGVASQGGLGLPNRDYYLLASPKFKHIRTVYQQHIAAMLTLLGDKPELAAQEAETIMRLETQLAQASLSPIALRDPMATYHMMGLQQLEAVTPNFSWKSYLSDRKQDANQKINLATPEFFKTLNQQLTTLPLDSLKTYVRWHLIDAYAPYLSKPFMEEDFKMNSVLTGTEKMLPRWKRVVNTENAALGFAIGQLYVASYFTESSREAVLKILKNIHKELKNDLQTLSWMSPTTRRFALKKLDMMEVRVGYPTKWRDYSQLMVDRGPYVLNVMRANVFLTNRDLGKIGKPVDRSEWAMTPQTINAYYDPSMNNINLPAGILQPPFFDPNAPDAVNYGAIGFVIGHEITHGFDDQGAKFDGLGNLKNWWTPEDLKRFKAATECIVHQYSQYRVDGDVPVQGGLVVGEATADLGGITLAYRAFLQSDAYKKAKVVKGYTPEQQFFLGAAHIWAANTRDQQLRHQVTTDPHPPARFRVNGSFANLPAFHKAFGLSQPSPMVNKKICVIW